MATIQGHNARVLIQQGEQWVDVTGGWESIQLVRNEFERASGYFNELGEVCLRISFMVWHRGLNYWHVVLILFVLAVAVLTRIL